MTNKRHLSRKVEAESGHTRRQFIGGALATVAACPLAGSVAARAADGSTDTMLLWIGAATVNITPGPPVALTGFQTVRITSTIQSPLTANVLAL